MNGFRISCIALIFTGIAAIACYGQMHQTPQTDKMHTGGGVAAEGHFHGDHVHVQSISAENRTDDDEKKDPAGEMVYITPKGKKYHVDGCRYLKKGKTAIPLSEALGSYKPCKVCKPPTK